MRWCFVALIAGFLVIGLALVARSIFFGVVAGYLYLFAYNRGMEYRRLRIWLTWPVPVDEALRFRCVRQFYWDMTHSPKALKITNRIATLSAVAGVVAIWTVIVLTGGFWIRILYIAICGTIAFLVGKWVAARRDSLRERKFWAAIDHAVWREVT